MNDIVSSFYPENRAGGFSRCDGTVQFYQRVRALLRPDYVVLDFGAGRGAAYYQDPSPYRKSLRNLRGEGRRVIGVDVDPVVSSNPCVDEAVAVSQRHLRSHRLGFDLRTRFGCNTDRVRTRSRAQGWWMDLYSDAQP